MKLFFKTFRWSLLFTVLAVAFAFWHGGLASVTIAGILIVVEIFVSFDNAIVNAKILNGMSEFWVKMFLSVGIIVAVFGVRFLLPIVLVSATTGLDMLSVVRLAFENGDPSVEGTYGHYVNDAHPQLASVAGVFLLMLFLGWLFSEKDHNWIPFIEKFGGKLNRFQGLSSVIAIIVLMIYANINADKTVEVLTAGMIGLGSYLAIHGLGELFSPDDDEQPNVAGELIKKTGKAGFVAFMYLEFIDASFSMDSLGAGLAITSDIVILMLGLGVGALYVRSMTVYLVHANTLQSFRYIESGAMWAIGVLSFILFYTINHHVSEFFTGSVSIVIIASAVIHSMIANKMDQKRGIEVEKIDINA